MDLGCKWLFARSQGGAHSLLLSHHSFSQAEAGGPTGGSGQGKASAGVQGVQGEAVASGEEEEGGTLPAEAPPTWRGWSSYPARGQWEERGFKQQQQEGTFTTVRGIDQVIVGEVIPRFGNNSPIQAMLCPLHLPPFLIAPCLLSHVIKLKDLYVNESTRKRCQQ